MGNRNPAVDTYIANAADFAQPILRHVREVVHQTCPDVEEAIKWKMPFFVYRDSILCHMAAFKAHCALGFWKGALVRGKPQEGDSAMGQFGRLESLADLPSDAELKTLLKKAMQLNVDGVPAPFVAERKLKTKVVLDVPESLRTRLDQNKKALAVFDAFPPGKRREYIEWINDAKTDATRNKRLDSAMEWIAEGKSRNWKYEKC